MSYPDPRYGAYNGGVCPESHPYALITLFYEFNFNTSPYEDRNFVFSQGDKSGHGFHGDFGEYSQPSRQARKGAAEGGWRVKKREEKC